LKLAVRMISEKDRETIIEIGRRYRASKILLFGSSAQPDREGNDIDLAVDGVSPSLYFEFYGDLILNLSKPADLVDLEQESRFTRLILAEGVPIYG
jgi:predicted nucleotidyltransferase